MLTMEALVTKLQVSMLLQGNTYPESIIIMVNFVTHRRQAQMRKILFVVGTALLKS